MLIDGTIRASILLYDHDKSHPNLFTACSDGVLTAAAAGKMPTKLIRRKVPSNEIRLSVAIGTLCN